MNLNPSLTEFTTGATDAMIVVECGVIMAILYRARAGDRFRAGLWCWTFGLLAFASILGTVTHGLDMPDSLRDALWKPLYLSLGMVVGLFVIGAIHDWLGGATAVRLVPWSVGVAIAFFGLTEIFDGAFIIFVLYEAAGMATALLIYLFLASTHRLGGAAVVAAAILLNLLASWVQASSLSLNLFVPLDHNGVFHLVQMIGLAVLGIGLHRGMTTGARRQPG